MQNTHPKHPGLEKQLGQIIQTELAVAPLRPLETDTPLFETMLDSTSILALVEHLEQQFHIQIDDQELVPANFSTLRNLSAFIARKTESAGAPLGAQGHEQVPVGTHP